MSHKILILLGMMLLVALPNAGAQEAEPLSPAEGGWMTLWVLEGDGEISNEEFEGLLETTCDDSDRSDAGCLALEEQNLLVPGESWEIGFTAEVIYDSEGRVRELENSSPGTV